MSLEKKKAAFPMAVWSPDGCSLAGAGLALGLHFHFGVSVLRDFKILQQEQC